MTIDEYYMQRALNLATLGLGIVSPNPLVGCVVVHNNIIIGEGWHKQYGGPHAEVNAIESVQDKSLLSDATVYVTLEPCAHFGKTPPCADLLIREKVKRVIVCNTDSNPLVGGKGLAKLRAAGIEVILGVLEEQGRWLNRRFFTFIEHKRPYVILKWAQTADGFIARSNFDSKWISHSFSRKLVHKWRTEENAILVGTRTAQYDNPQLNVRDWSGSNPIRLVLDKQLEIPTSHYLFDQSQSTICYNFLRQATEGLVDYVQIDRQKASLPQILQDLYQRKIQSLFVEGGSYLLTSFIQSNLWDEIRLFKSPQQFHNGISAPNFSGVQIDQKTFYEDTLTYFVPIT